MKAANKVAANTGILYAKMGITVFISLYTLRLILTALGAEGFGIFNVVGGAIALLGFLNASMASASQRFMSYNQGAGESDKLKQIFNVSIVLHFLIAMVLIVLLEIAGYFFLNGLLNISPDRLPAAKMIYHFMVVSTVFSVLAVPYDAVINAHENMLIFAILGIVESVLKLIIAIFITYTSHDQLIVYGLLMSALSIFLLIIRVLYCSRKYGECILQPLKNFSQPIFKEMTGFASWTFIGSSTSIVAYYGQGIVLNMFFGTVVNAAQGIAHQISGQLGAFSSTMLNALNPVIAKSEGAGDRSLMVKASMLGSKISFFLLMFFITPVIVEMPYILSVWLKEVPPHTVIFCRLLLIRNLIEQLFYTLSASISAVGNIKEYQIFSSVITFFPLVVAYFLFKVGYAPYALYIVFIGYSIVASLNKLYFSRKTFALSIKVYSKKVILPCVSNFIISLLIALLPTFILPEGFPRFVCVVLMSTASFVFLMYGIGFNKEERLGFTQMVHVIRVSLAKRARILFY